MARGRMISKSLSTSQKRAALHDVAGRLVEFAQGLYPLLVVHADDFGRLQGDLFSVKHIVDPCSRRKEPEFAEALTALDRVGLIQWYEASDRKYIQILNFNEHQNGLHRRTQSQIPAPGATHVTEERPPFSMSEQDVEQRCANDLSTGHLRVGDFVVLSVDRQVRVDNSYIDIMAKTEQGPAIVIEVKRQRVSKAAIAQVQRYAALLAPLAVVPCVIGHGLAAGLQPTGALVGIYDDDLVIRSVSSFNVMERDLTFTHVPFKGKGTELKGTEGKRTELKKESAAAAPPPLAPVVENPVENPDDNVEVITTLVQKELLPLGIADNDLIEVAKERCAKLKIAYTGSVVRKAVESAQFRAHLERPMFAPRGKS